MRKPRLYKEGIDYLIAWIEVRKDLNDPAGSSPVPSKRTPYSFEQALLMFDITKRQSDSLWDRTMRLVKKPATANRYRLLDEWIVVRRKTLILQMHYIRRAKDLQVTGDVHQNQRILERDQPLVEELKRAQELQTVIDAQRSADAAAHR